MVCQVRVQTLNLFLWIQLLYLAGYPFHLTHNLSFCRFKTFSALKYDASARCTFCKPRRKTYPAKVCRRVLTPYRWWSYLVLLCVPQTLLQSSQVSILFERSEFFIQSPFIPDFKGRGFLFLFLGIHITDIQIVPDFFGIERRDFRWSHSNTSMIRVIILIHEFR